MALRLLVLIGFFSLSTSLFGQKEINFDTIRVNIQFTQDPENPSLYRLNCITNSLDLFGTVNFYDPTGKVLLQYKELEIAHDPGYHIIEINEFPKGEIKVEIFVDDVPYTQIFHL